MVVDDLNIICSVIMPSETDTPLVVDPDRMAAAAISLHRFEAIAGRRSQIIEPLGAVDKTKLDEGLLLNVGWKLSAFGTAPDSFRFSIGEASYHAYLYPITL